MKIRLGYVAMILELEDCSPSGTVTLKTLQNITDVNARLSKVIRVASKNINNTYRILKFNKAYGIKVFRITSRLIPLSTHPVMEGWDYVECFSKEFLEIGDYIKKNGFRISAHPDHFTLLNSRSDEVTKNSIKDLDYHVKIFEAMGLNSNYKLVMHVGGSYGDKKAAIIRFKKRYDELPDRIKSRIILENDDRCYSASDVLSICRDMNIPMVLDVHHHSCINNGEKLETMLAEIYDTWKNELMPPKLHFSSPKDCSAIRKHADYINIDEFVTFLKTACQVDQDIDVMIEAKNKEKALLKLSRELSKTEGVKRINNAEFKIEKGGL